MNRHGLFADSVSDTIRKGFPALSEYTFLNAASMTPLPTVSREAMSALLSEMSKSAYLGIPEWVKKGAEARKTAANLVNASENEIAFVRNTSDGVSLAASGLRFEPGDEVIINDIEFPSNVYPWLNLERKGVIVKTVISENGRVTPDMIAKQVTSRTKVLAISSVQYLSGYRADLAALGQMARDRDFRFFVDTIQSLGVIPLDVKGAGIDFMSCGGFKWLCGPLGSGIFYCDENRLDELDLNRVGWNSVTDSDNYPDIDFTLRPGAQRFEEGSPNMAGIFGLLESIKLVSSQGIENNEAHVIALTDHLVDRLLSKGCACLSPREEGEKSGIVIFTPPSGQDVEELEKRLNAEKILVIRRGAGIRVSPHFYNTTDDIDRLISAL